MRLFECFYHKVVIGGVRVLKQCSLHELFFAPGHIHLSHVKGVDARVIHAGGHSERSGIKILHLLGIDAVALGVESKLYGIFECAAWVAAHKIRHCILLLARPFRRRIKAGAKLVIHLCRRLTHESKHPVADVLGGNAELPTHMMLTKLTQKRVAFVGKKIIIANTRANEHLLYAGNCAHGS